MGQGAFNPARVYGPAVYANQWKNQELYWIADFFGAALAAIIQSYLIPCRK
jgi:glycerol uptake facilitator-like aquaporin